MEEIKASDIMIGNYFKYDNKIVFIAEILKTKLVTIYDGSGLEKGTTLGCLRPIPLTEDILLKAGGERFDEDKIILMLNDPSTHLVLMKVGTHWYPQIEQTGEFASEGFNVVFLNFIDYIHQAQNLFKSLTGNDLKIEV